MKTANKFKVVDRRDETEWDGEEINVQSKTTIQDDKGIGQAISLRTFEFAANPEAFKHETPSYQQLFDSHLKGIQSMLWVDGMKPYEAVEPRILISKDKTHYKIVVACTPNEVLLDKPQTLDQLLNASKYTE